MDKKFLLLALPVLCLTGCKADFSGETKPLGRSKIENKSEEKLPDPDTPEWWIEMFTCKNVTIKNTHKTTGTEIIEYKYVEGMLYKKGPSDISFIIYPDPTFDMLLEYKNSYQTFKMEEHDATCSCSNWRKYEGNAWLYSANLYFSDDKLYKIEETSTLNDLTFGDIYEFSNWGETTI